MFVLTFELEDGCTTITCASAAAALDDVHATDANTARLLRIEHIARLCGDPENCSCVPVELDLEALALLAAQESA